MGFDPFAGAFVEMTRRMALGSLPPKPVQRDSPGSPFALAFIAVVGAFMSAAGAWVKIGVLTDGGPSVVAVGLFGTVYLLGGSWYRNCQGQHWLELQQTRAEIWRCVEANMWPPAAYAADLRSHFPSEMGEVPVVRHLADATPDPDPDPAKESKLRELVFDGLNEISVADRLTRPCARCKRWAWLRILPFWAADVEHPPPAVLG